MDWSLVLASQGITHRIDHDETNGWSLTVAAADHPAAVEHIRQYRLENRYWRWRHPIFRPGMYFDGTSVIWAWPSSVSTPSAGSMTCAVPV
jgi:hypothetical protein